MAIEKKTVVCTKAVYDEMTEVLNALGLKQYAFVTDAIKEKLQKFGKQKTEPMASVKKCG